MTTSTPDKNALHERLTMPTVAESRAQAEAAMRETQTKPERVDDPKMAENYRFELDIEAGGGRRYKGAFENAILTMGQRKMVGVMRANQCAGAPVECFTVDTFKQIFWSCWMSLSLKEVPSWFEDVDAIKDPIVFEKVAQEVEAHEATFHKPVKPSGTGASSV